MKLQASTPSRKHNIPKMHPDSHLLRDYRRYSTSHSRNSFPANIRILHTNKYFISGHHPNLFIILQLLNINTLICTVEGFLPIQSCQWGHSAFQSTPKVIIEGWGQNLCRPLDIFRTSFDKTCLYKPHFIHNMLERVSISSNATEYTSRHSR